jgi:hypothetical protein
MLGYVSARPFVINTGDTNLMRQKSVNISVIPEKSGEHCWLSWVDDLRAAIGRRSTFLHPQSV